MNINRRIFAATVTGLALASVAASVWAQDYPSRPIRIVVPFPPGGALDTYVRTIQGGLQDELQQTVILENVPGAGGAIGASAVARAQPDGYTLMAGPIQTLSMNTAIYPKLTYDPLKDFTPVVQTVMVNYMLVTRSSLPIRSMAELLEYARENPGRLTYATSGAGSAQHMAVALLQAQAGLDFLHVPYKGMGPAITDLLGGQVDFTIADQPSLMPHVKSGRLRALAAAGSKRIADLPELPTLAEAASLPDYEAVAWQGIVAPAGTPDAVVQRVNQAVNRVHQIPEVRARLEELGFELVGGGAAEFGEYLAADIAKWKQVAQENNIRID